jgi:glycosyltransferase involved in cell wall biosynthesis
MMPVARPVAMIVHAYYEEDPRVRREAEALVAVGRPVTVFALRRPGTAREERLAGVDVRRLGVQRHQGASLAVYLLEYLGFLVRAALALARVNRRRRFALVQVHSIPDFLVAAALPLRLTGVPVILDLHEAMPDFFRYRFPRAANPLAYRALLLQERLSLAMADQVITVNDALAARLRTRGVGDDRLTVIPNVPSLARFDPGAHAVRRFMEDGTLRLAYAGALSPTYELDVAIRAVAEITAARPEVPVVLDLYGRDFAEVGLADLARDLGLADRVRFHGRIAIEEVPAALAAADIALAPTRRNPFTEHSLSTKLFESVAMAKPTVATRLPLVERTFAADEIRMYEPGDAADLARAILAYVDDAHDREARVARARLRVADMSWEREAVRYLELVDRTIARGDRPPIR